MSEDRLLSTDTGMVSIMKLSEGNPEAMKAIIEMMRISETIDPDNFLGPIGVLLNLDSFRIYESKICILFKDNCRSSPTLSLGILRCVQMGILPLLELTNALSSEKPLSIERIKELYSELKKVLPLFDKTNEGEKAWKE